MRGHFAPIPPCMWRISGTPSLPLRHQLVPHRPHAHDGQAQARSAHSPTRVHQGLTRSQRDSLRHRHWLRARRLVHRPHPDHRHRGNASDGGRAGSSKRWCGITRLPAPHRQPAQHPWRRPHTDGAGHTKGQHDAGPALGIGRQRRNHQGGVQQTARQQSPAQTAQQRPSDLPQATPKRRQRSRPCRHAAPPSVVGGAPSPIEHIHRGGLRLHRHGPLRPAP